LVKKLGNFECPLAITDIFIPEKVGIMDEYVSKPSEEISGYKEKAGLFPSYLSGLSHDIRTPLNSIIGFADLLKESNVSRNDQRLYSQMIVRSSRRLLNLMSDLIDLARIETGNLVLYEQKIYLSELIEELSDEVNEMKMLFGKNNIQILFSLQEDAPAYFLTDRNRLMQILRIILDNSLKFTEKGKISLQVSYLPGKEIVFQVIDTGCGMSKETVDTLFDLFPSESGPDAKLKSRGLSLLVVSKLCEMMGGTLRVQSAVNEGTAFTLSFPA